MGLDFVESNLALECGRAITEPLDRSACLLAIKDGLRRHQPRDLFAMPSDDNLLTLLDQVEKMAQPVLCFEGADLLHQDLPVEPAYF
jgi:hypothetical protein